MMKRLLKNNLLLKVIIAIILGVWLGGLVPKSIARIFITFNTFFSNFLGFFIPLIIIGLIVPAIAQLGKNAGKLLFWTVGIAFGSTVVAGFFGYVLGIQVFPDVLSGTSAFTRKEAAAHLMPYFTLAIPSLIDITSALVLSFTLGIGIAAIKSQRLEDLFVDFQDIIMGLIGRVIIPLLPVYIFGIFLSMSYHGEAFLVLGTFGKVIGITIVASLLYLLLQYLAAALVVKRNPFILLKNMLPAFATALGTQSSAATIPITLKQALANKITPKTTGFVVPLCATIHLSGSALHIVACSVALVLLHGDAASLMQYAGFILMLSITMVAAPGVPGGAIMASLGILHSILGFNAEAQTLMIAVINAMDSVATACNVVGDGAIALVIDKLVLKTRNSGPEVSDIV